MAIFSLFKYNQSNRIDVRIGDGTVKITTILTVTAGPAPGERDWGGGQNYILQTYTQNTGICNFLIGRSNEQRVVFHASPSFQGLGCFGLSKKESKG